MKKFLLIAVILLVVALVLSCMAPMPMTAPNPDIPKPAPIPDEGRALKKKMCVGHDCRYMGAVDSGGTTRGHSNDDD